MRIERSREGLDEWSLAGPLAIVLLKNMRNPWAHLLLSSSGDWYGVPLVDRREVASMTHGSIPAFVSCRLRGRRSRCRGVATAVLLACFLSCFAGVGFAARLRTHLLEQADTPQRPVTNKRDQRRLARGSGKPRRGAAHGVNTGPASGDAVSVAEVAAALGDDCRSRQPTRQGDKKRSSNSIDRTKKKKGKRQNRDSLLQATFGL